MKTFIFTFISLSLFLTFDAQSSLRCPRQKPNQVECDASHRQRLGRNVRMIALQDKDSASFVQIVKKFRQPEVVGEGKNQTVAYKFMTDNLSVMFMCVSSPTRIGCRLYYNPEKRENNVQIAENNVFVNIRFSKPEVVKAFETVFRENGGAKAYVADEIVSVRPSINEPVKSYRRISLACANQKCELRGVTAGAPDEQQQDGTPVEAGD